MYKHLVQLILNYFNLSSLGITFLWRDKSHLFAQEGGREGGEQLIIKMMSVRV